jgi:glycosyltransferase involved in cell wall biosynthesis
MKIYFNTYSAAFQCPGGGEIQLIKSKEALERRGHKVALFNPWQDKLSDADVIHHFSVQGGSYNLCAYAHNHRIPLVVSPILWLSEYIDQYPMGEVGLMLSMADIICPNSLAEVERFTKHFSEPLQKYHVTHNGVDACFFDSAGKNLFLAKHRINFPFVLCVGNIEARKNQMALLEASMTIGIHTVLIGNVRDNGYFQQMNEKFAGKFTYLGYMEHGSPILRSAYAACSAFALPSLLETPGLAALEAAAAGANMVITKEGCTEEYFGKEAHYVDPKSIEDISEKLRMAITSKIQKAALTDRVRQFTWDLVAEELEGAYLKAQISSRAKSEKD